NYGSLARACRVGFVPAARSKAWTGQRATGNTMTSLSERRRTYPAVGRTPHARAMSGDRLWDHNVDWGTGAAGKPPPRRHRPPRRRRTERAARLALKWLSPWPRW